MLSQQQIDEIAEIGKQAGFTLEEFKEYLKEKGDIDFSFLQAKGVGDADNLIGYDEHGNEINVTNEIEKLMK